MPRIGIYWLPNIITTASLGSGFIAILNILSGDFIVASRWIFLSVVLDALDGHVARLTRTDSRFGAEYDSLTDTLVFGCVPALLALQWLLNIDGIPGAPEIIYVATFFHLMTTSLRLARFNVHTQRKVFLGLPSPAAAVLLTSLIVVLEKGGHYGAQSAWLVIVMLFVCGASMVGNMSYYSLKNIDFRQRVRLTMLAAAIVLLTLLIKDFARVLFALSLMYLLSSPALYVWRWLRRRRHTIHRRRSTHSHIDPP